MRAACAAYDPGSPPELRKAAVSRFSLRGREAERPQRLDHLAGGLEEAVHVHAGQPNALRLRPPGIVLPQPVEELGEVGVPPHPGRVADELLQGLISRSIGAEPAHITIGSGHARPVGLEHDDRRALLLDEPAGDGGPLTIELAAPMRRLAEQDESAHPSNPHEALIPASDSAVTCGRSCSARTGAAGCPIATVAYKVRTSPMATRRNRMGHQLQVWCLRHSSDGHSVRALRLHGAAVPMSPQVSIIIPAFLTSTHQEELLEETLATVEAQTCQDFEVIVVDDGSPLPVQGAVVGGRSTTVIRQTNGGSARARNTGIAASRGRFLVFLDADDHLLPMAVQRGLQALAAHPEAGFAVGPREEMTYEGGPVPWAVAAPPEGVDIYEPLLAFASYIIPPSSVMFRREVVNAIGGFRDPWGADDLDFYLRAAWSFKAHCYQAPPVTRYRRYSASSSRDGERMLHSIRTVYARQQPLVKGQPHLERAWAHGLAQLTRIFEDSVVENVIDRVHGRQWRRAMRSAVVLARERPRRLAEAARMIFTSSAARRPA